MIATLGFIGVGVMGEPICRHLAQSSGCRVLASDLRSPALQRLAGFGVATADSIPDLARSDIVFMSLPSAEALQSVCDRLLPHLRSGQMLVDLGTSPVTLTRELAARCRQHGVGYADAPVSRTRQAAEEGTLNVMVGGTAADFERIRALLDCFASEVTHCGPVGSGQIAKLMNNMVLFQTVVALAEALTVARRAGMDGAVLFETMSKGSADSFALRNHGMKAMLPGVFPERAFATDYAQKDLAYAMALADECGVRLAGAEAAKRLLAEASRAGYGAQYFPALVNVVEQRR